MIQTARIQEDIEAIARFTETPGRGATRPTFSRAWGEARAYVIARAEAAGCVVRTDAAGNLRARHTSLPPDAPAYLVGSHLDTVPHGGDYDGVAGVAVALELLRSAKEDGIDALPVELIVFAEEEGPTFGLGMLGSRALVGDITVGHLEQLRNREGKSYLEAGAPYGVRPDAIAASRLRGSDYLGLIELHIEQGPGMWRRDVRLAVVTAIAGRWQYRVTIEGEANHAGATAMGDRKDALVAAASVVARLESLAREIGEDAVVTVGRLNVVPNAVNVIPSEVEFTIDFRSPDDLDLDLGDRQIRAAIQDVCHPRGLKFRTEHTEQIPARPMSPKLVEAFRALGVTATAVSGALHDSAVLAPHLPTVMLFVPSQGGISHNPAEFSRVEDIAEGARAVERLVRRPTLSQVNAMDRAAFVGVCGTFFEHSPWVAERAWERRPFASLADLHAAMCDAVRAASADEQLALIRAHPDLVGRLARENRLTAESTAEQTAAGLTALSAEEVEAFERLNATYREKFGFPFVICARQNNKEAILAAFPVRLRNSPEQERAAALAEIDKIAELRLRDAIMEESSPQMNADERR